MSHGRWSASLFPEHTTLASRLVILFTLGSAILMSGIGFWLYHALTLQLDERDLAEVHGKTEVIQHLLGEIASPAELGANLGRFRDISVGHPHINASVASGGAWLLKPPAAVRTAIEAEAFLPQLRPDHYTSLTINDAIWWVSKISYQWPKAGSPSIDVYLAVDVSESRMILRDHGIATLLAVLLGSVGSGLLAFFVARRGLAPIAIITAEAERVTSERLGAPLDIQHAPREIRSLVESLNRMLDRLGESFRSLEQFSADIAHELRTPLNNLMLQTQVTLSRPREAADYQEALLGNLEELERLQRMVSDMLFLARADRGMLPLQPEQVDLRAEADSLAEFFELAASERQQHITVMGNATVTGDRLMVRRAITNLLSNAVRYAPANAAISVDLSVTERGAMLWVSNSCETIAAETLARLFTRFTRNDDARSRDTDGVGLGLAIVESIMRLHGGSVSAQQEDGLIAFRLTFSASPL